MVYTSVLPILFILLTLGQSNILLPSNKPFTLSAELKTVQKMCWNFRSRNDLVTTSSRQQAKSSKKTMFQLFGSGNQLIVRIIKNQNNTNSTNNIIQEQLRNLSVPLIFYIGPFIIGLFVIILIFPYLCCCCCCSCCCECYRNQQNRYTKCEMMWPSIILILALIVMTISGIFGVLTASQIKSSYLSIGCSVGYSLQDIIYGNKSSQGFKFIGLQFISNSLFQLQNNITEVDQQMQKIGFSNTSGSVYLAYQSGNSLLDGLSKVPNGSFNGQMTSFGYKNFDNTGSDTSVISKFPDILGTTSPQSPSGIIYTAFTTISQTNQIFKTIGQNIDNFTTQVDSISSTLQSMYYSVDEVNKNFLKFDSFISETHDSMNPIIDLATTSSIAFYALFIGLGAIGIISTVLMTFCNKFSCRYLLYFICVLKVLLGVICFLLVISLSTATPAMYFGCDFVTTSVSSSANFERNFQNIIIDNMTSDYIQICLPGGDGNITEKYQGMDLSGINALINSVNQINQFNSSFLQSNVEKTLQTLQSQIRKYFYTDELDFDSENDLNILRKISSSSNYDCTYNYFKDDRWIPSLKQNIITCQGTSKTASTNQCSSSTQIINGKTGPGDCYGCIDTMRALENSGSPVKDVQGRYWDGSDGCNAFIFDFTNLWDSYYSVKITKLSPVKMRSENLKQAYEQDYKNKIQNVGIDFEQISVQLKQISKSVFDLQDGVISGLNCLILGEDVNLMADVICINIFNTIYWLRLATAALAMSILVVLCCSTCSGVRAYRQSNHKKYIKVPRNMTAQKEHLQRRLVESEEF